MIERQNLPTARLLAQALQQKGLWLDPPSYAREFSRRRHVEHRLFAAPAAHNLPTWHDLVRHIGFGRRSRASVPLNLAFGYQMAGFIARTDPPQIGEAGAKLAGCFNLGVSMFDRVCDSPRLGLGALARVIDRTVLEELLDGPDTRTRFLQPYESTASPTVRLLLLSMFAFFEELDALLETADTQERTTLRQLLQDAYEAQMDTTRPASATHRADLACSARAKTVLTLRIFARLARLGMQRDEGPSSDLDEFATTIGHLFSLVDDVVDLPKDRLEGEANTLLLQAEAEGQPAECCVHAAIAEVADLLQKLRATSSAVSEDRLNILLFWVRTWVQTATWGW